MPLSDLLGHWDWFYGEVCGFEYVGGHCEGWERHAKVLEGVSHLEGRYWNWGLPGRWDPDART